MSAYPGSLDSDSTLLIAKDYIQTKLSAPQAIGDSVAIVASSAGWVPYMVLTVDVGKTNVEQQLVTAVAGNILTVTRSFGGTSASAHAQNAVVSNNVDAVYQSSLKAAVIAIETALGANLSNVPPAISVSSAQYDFGARTSGSGVTVAGGNLIIGNNTLTFAIVPPGVNGADIDHYLYVDNGTGTAEAVLITGGAGVAGQVNGQIIVLCANTHSGAWTIASATAGIAEAVVAINALGGGTVYVLAGTYTLKATTRLFSGTTIQGAGIFVTVLQRTGDFGSSFVSGTALAGAIDVHLRDLQIKQIINYVPGAPPTVSNKPTSGAHWLMQGPNTCGAERCRFENLVYGIRIVGGADVVIQDCQFQSLWTFGQVTGQIGIAAIQTNHDATLGIPTYIKLRGNQYYGYPDIDPTRYAGPQFMIQLNSCEDLEIVGGSMGGAESSNLHISPSSGQVIAANIRIAGVKFDGATFADMRILSDGVLSAVNVTVTGCVFNGENISTYGLHIDDHGSGVAGIVGLNVTGSIFFAYLGTPLKLLDGLGLNLSGNTIYFYNNAVFATAADGSGIYIGGRANDYVITGNMIGGGQAYAAYGASNHCLFGISILDAVTANGKGNIVPNYAPFPTAIGTAADLVFNTLISQEQFIATETGANNAIAGALPNIPLLTGLRVTVKLAHTLQAGANTFNLNAGGAVNIKSSRNVANNIGTAYAATGTIVLLYDGTQWVDVSQ